MVIKETHVKQLGTYVDRLIRNTRGLEVYFNRSKIPYEGRKELDYLCDFMLFCVRNIENHPNPHELAWEICNTAGRLESLCNNGLWDFFRRSAEDGETDLTIVMEDFHSGIIGLRRVRDELMNGNKPEEKSSEDPEPGAAIDALLNHRDEGPKAYVSDGAGPYRATWDGGSAKARKKNPALVKSLDSLRVPNPRLCTQDTLDAVARVAAADPSLVMQSPVKYPKLVAVLKKFGPGWKCWPYNGKVYMVKSVKDGYGVLEYDSFEDLMRVQEMFNPVK